MSNEPLLVERRDAVAVVSINDPLQEGDNRLSDAT
jgi:hypothetical protein